MHLARFYGQYVSGPILFLGWAILSEVRLAHVSSRFLCRRKDTSHCLVPVAGVEPASLCFTKGLTTVETPPSGTSLSEGDLLFPQ